MDAVGSPKRRRKDAEQGVLPSSTNLPLVRQARRPEGDDEDDQRRTAFKMRKLFEKSIISEINKKLWARRAREKRYFLHYEKGKYNLVNLDLKKKGHDQRY